jgi:hypothetical protein
MRMTGDDKLKSVSWKNFLTQVLLGKQSMEFEPILLNVFHDAESSGKSHWSHPELLKTDLYHGATKNNFNTFLVILSQVVKSCPKSWGLQSQ